MPSSAATRAPRAKSVARVARAALDLDPLQRRDPLEGAQQLRVLAQHRRRCAGASRPRSRLTLVASACAAFSSVLERAVRAQQLGGGLRADARCARQAVGRVAAQRDEVGDQLRLDAVALAHLAPGRSRRARRPCAARRPPPARRPPRTGRGRRSAAAPVRPPADSARGEGEHHVVGLQLLAVGDTSSRGPPSSRGRLLPLRGQLRRHRVAVGVVGRDRARTR